MARGGTRRRAHLPPVVARAAGVEPRISARIAVGGDDRATPAPRGRGPLRRDVPRAGRTRPGGAARPATRVGCRGASDDRGYDGARGRGGGRGPALVGRRTGGRPGA